MKNYSNCIVAIYIYIMPFTAAFALASVFPVPLIFLIGVTSLLIVIAKLKYFIFKKYDLLLFLIIFLGITPWSTLSTLTSKNTNHAGAIAVSIFFYFFIVRFLLFNQVNFTWDKFTLLTRTSLFLISITIIIEFISASFFGLYFSDFIPFPDKNLLGQPDLLENFKRPRVFATEAGFMALYFDMFLPLIFLLDNKKTKNIIIWFVILLGYFLLASAASIFSITFAMLIMFVLLKERKKMLILVLSGLFLTFLYCLVDQIQFFFDSVVFRKYDILLKTSLVDMSDRPYIYHTSLKIIGEYPLGIGWGTLSQVFQDGVGLDKSIPPIIGAGAISLFLEIGIASGWLGLFFLFLFVTRKIFLLFRLNKVSKKNSYPSPALAVAVSLTAVSTHHIFVSVYYFPFFWFSLALADFTLYYHKKNKKVR